MNFSNCVSFFFRSVYLYKILCKFNFVISVDNNLGKQSSIVSRIKFIQMHAYTTYSKI